MKSVLLLLLLLLPVLQLYAVPSVCDMWFLLFSARFVSLSFVSICQRQLQLLHPLHFSSVLYGVCS
jgi:hypothetical protein